MFGTVIDDRMRDEVKDTVIPTGFDGQSKPAAPGRRAAVEIVTPSEQGIDERGRQLLAEIERERGERQQLEQQMADRARSPWSSREERPAPEPARTPRERSTAPARPASLERPDYAESELDIPSFLRRRGD